MLRVGSFSQNRQSFRERACGTRPWTEWQGRWGACTQSGHLKGHCMHISTSSGSLGLTTCPDKLTPAYPTFLPTHPLLSPRRHVLGAVWELELHPGVESWGLRQPPKGHSCTAISTPRQGSLGVAERLQQTVAHSRPNHHLCTQNRDRRATGLGALTTLRLSGA